MPTLTIREEQPGDERAIREINREAFDTGVEADLVDRLRETCPERLSLVALVDDTPAGHLLFTPVTVRADGRVVEGMGLAPMAVRPNCQQQGVGSALAWRGLEMVRAAGYPFVVVLGHPDYYPRFGFERAADYGLACEYEGVPAEAFMIVVFAPEIVRAASGVVRYRPEFASTL